MTNSYRGSNRLIQEFNKVEQTTHVPFKGNQLISKNPNISSQVNQMVRNKTAWVPNGGTNGGIDGKTGETPNDRKTKMVRNERGEKKKVDFQDLSKLNNPNLRREDIIKELLKPIETTNKHDNKEIKEDYEKLLADYSYDTRRKVHIQSKKFDITNEPYKIIMKEHRVDKPVNEIEEKDMIVFDTKNKKQIEKSKNIGLFLEQYKDKRKEMKRINAYLALEYDDRNHDNHLEKYKYKEAYVRRLKDDNGKSFDETKSDYIDFYKDQQAIAEKGMKEIDSTLKLLANQGFISKDELPE